MNFNSSLPCATKLRRLCFYTCLVILFIGGSASVHAGIPSPREQTPPRSRHPLEADLPQTRHPPRADTPGPGTPRPDTPGSRHPPSRHPPDIPPEQPSPPPPGSRPSRQTATVTDGTHPTGMHFVTFVNTQNSTRCIHIEGPSYEIYVVGNTFAMNGYGKCLCE